MPTTVINAGANSGGLASSASAYADVQAGTGTLATQATLVSGQRYRPAFGRDAYLRFLEFDLSSLAGNTVTAAEWHDRCGTNSYPAFAAADYVAADEEVRLHDFGAALTTADWMSGATFGGKTLLCSFHVYKTEAATFPNNDEEQTFALSGTALVTAINASIVAGAPLRVVVGSSRYRTATDPNMGAFDHLEYVTWTGIASQPPHLALTYIPGIYSLSINSGAASTDDNDMTLTPGTTGAAPSYMCFSEDGGTTWSAWEAWSTSRAWELAAQTSYPTEARTILMAVR